jgi:hypothetical protein
MEGPFRVEFLPTLPEYTPGDEAHEIYVEDEEKRYYADATSWVDYATFDCRCNRSIEIDLMRSITEFSFNI